MYDLYRNSLKEKEKKKAALLSLLPHIEAIRQWSLEVWEVWKDV